MSVITWIAVGVIVAGATGVLTLRKLRSRDQQDNYGAVSDQWVSQHRSDQPYDR